jgi:hypothetical protein
MEMRSGLQDVVASLDALKLQVTDCRREFFRTRWRRRLRRSMKTRSSLQNIVTGLNALKLLHTLLRSTFRTHVFCMQTLSFLCKRPRTCCFQLRSLHLANRNVRTTSTSLNHVFRWTRYTGSSWRPATMSSTIVNRPKKMCLR